MTIPPIVYYGSKTQFLHILSNYVPAGGKPYCEPYMGSASLFFSRTPATIEVLNDLDESLVNLFRCLQDEELYRKLSHRLRFTLYSYSEFNRAISILKSGTDDPILRAWALFVKSAQMFCTGPRIHRTGWARTLQTSGKISKKISQWITRLSMLEEWHQRLLLVNIECRDSLEVISYWDNPEAVFYLDPPYIQETRDPSSLYVYNHEATIEHYERLIDLILSAKGSITISGYAHPIYTKLIQAGWLLFQFQSVTRLTGSMRKQKSRRTECILINPRCAELLKKQNSPILT